MEVNKLLAWVVKCTFISLTAITFALLFAILMPHWWIALIIMTGVGIFFMVDY